jgi:hypothetical protein
MRVTSIRRPLATMRSMLVVANPALISSIRSEKWISADHERAGVYLGQGREDGIKIVFGARVQDVEL